MEVNCLRCSNKLTSSSTRLIARVIKWRPFCATRRVIQTTKGIFVVVSDTRSSKAKPKPFWTKCLHVLFPSKFLAAQQETRMSRLKIQNNKYIVWKSPRKSPRQEKCKAKNQYFNDLVCTKICFQSKHKARNEGLIKNLETSNDIHIKDHGLKWNFSTKVSVRTN